VTTVIPTARPTAALSSFLDAGTADLVAVVAAGVAVIALLVAVVALVRLSRLRRSYTLLQGDDEHGSFVDAVDRKTREVEGLRAQVEALSGDVGRVRDDLADAIRHVAVVRYDAFGDMGGRLSFSVALLDDTGDGLVLTSINGRSETRTYAKGVKRGASEAPLSPEEEQVIGYALRRAAVAGQPPRGGRTPS
jgi:hypothetical protein